MKPAVNYTTPSHSLAASYTKRHRSLGFLFQCPYDKLYTELAVVVCWISEPFGSDGVIRLPGACRTFSVHSPTSRSQTCTSSYHWTLTPSTHTSQSDWQRFQELLNNGKFIYIIWMSSFFSCVDRLFNFTNIVQ